VLQISSRAISYTILEKQDIEEKRKDHGKRGGALKWICCLFVKQNLKATLLN
jgi:hypothetical protein